MKLQILGISMLAFAALAGCQPQAKGPMKTVIVSGTSNASSAEAVREAQAAIRAAERFGYQSISIGGGSAAAGGEESAQEYSVYVLMEGPTSAPNILPNGKAAP